MKVGRNLIILAVAAIIAGVGAVYLANKYISSRVAQAEAAIRSRYELVEIVVPRHDLSAGAIIDYSNMAVRKMPQAFVNPHAITPATFSSVKGRQLASPVAAGTPLLRSHVSIYSSGAFSARVHEGMRALTLPVDTVSSVGGLVAPGDYVDLLLTTQTRSGRPVTVPLLTHVKILATGTNYIGPNRHTFRDVTVEVTPKNASRLLLAQRIGSISTTLRGPHDSGQAFQQAMTPQELFTGQYAYLFAPPPTPPPQEEEKPSVPMAPPIQLIIGNTG